MLICPETRKDVIKEVLAITHPVSLPNKMRFTSLSSASGRWASSDFSRDSNSHEDIFLYIYICSHHAAAASAVIPGCVRVFVCFHALYNAGLSDATGDFRKGRRFIERRSLINRVKAEGQRSHTFPHKQLLYIL